MLVVILSIFGIIIAAILLAALVMPKAYTISSSTVINRSQAEVFDFVKHLRNQEQYSKWVMADPNVQLTYTGTDGTVGFKAAWVSEDKNVGVGEQEITSIIEGKRYDVEIRFEKPMKGISQAHTTTEGIAENQTKVTTVFETETPFPFNVMVPLIKKMLQKDLDLNGATLKGVLEK